MIFAYNQKLRVPPCTPWFFILKLTLMVADTLCVNLITFHHGGHGVSRRKNDFRIQSKLRVPPCTPWFFILTNHHGGHGVSRRKNDFRINNLTVVKTPCSSVYSVVFYSYQKKAARISLRAAFSAQNRWQILCALSDTGCVNLLFRPVVAAFGIRSGPSTSV